MTLDEIDKVGLIREAYRMHGISLEECRSIFVDWALRLPVEHASGSAIRLLLDQYGHNAPDHPMSQVLKEGLGTANTPRRRGGRNARIN